MKRAAIVILLVGLAWPLAGFSDDPPDSAATSAPKLPRKIDSEHLPNSYRLSDKVISGGQPEGEAAFAELRTLGVKTIISVDGAKPEVALAKKYGLRYVHLPHGYDGIADERVRELAKAVRDLPGPIYVHCHHGKHRSPAAAAAACIAVGMLGPADGLAVLKTAGTSPNYRGLYDTVRAAKKLNPAALDGLKVEFRETVEVPPLAEAMVAIEQVHDRLKEIAAAGWKSPPDHPDLDPPHEALLAKEHFTELLRTEAVQKKPARFKAMVGDSEQAAGELERALRAAPPDEKRTSAAFGKLSNNCQECHKAFRDVPLGEKHGR